MVGQQFPNTSPMSWRKMTKMIARSCELRTGRDVRSNRGKPQQQTRPRRSSEIRLLRLLLLAIVFVPKPQFSDPTGARVVAPEAVSYAGVSTTGKPVARVVEDLAQGQKRQPNRVKCAKVCY